MIAGVCFKDSKVNQVFRRDEAFCAKCGGKLLRVSITNVDGVPNVQLESEE